MDDMSPCTHLKLLHMVVRSGCGVALVGYMSGRDTAQSLGSRQGVVLMTLSVCYINEFSVLCQPLGVRLLCSCGSMVFVLCADH